MNTFKIIIKKSTSINRNAQEDKLWDISDSGIILTPEEEDEIAKEFIEHHWETDIFVDGKVLKGFVPLSTILVLYNFKEIDNSRLNEELFTSEFCDIPEDIGIFSGVDMLQSKDSIVWTTSDPETIRILGADKLEFSSEEMRTELKNIWKTLYLSLEEGLMSDGLLYSLASDTIKTIKMASPQYYLSIWDANKEDK